MKNKMIASVLALTVLTTQITAFASDNTNGMMIADDGNNVDFSEVMQNGAEQTQLNQPAAQPTTGITADFDGFHKQMDAFLESAGFDYSEFTSQKFSLPDMTNISTEADMKEQYAEMVAGLSAYGFGQKATLPDNSGYTLNAIGSFKDSFGDGLKSEFTPYTEFTFDSQVVFADFSANRDSLFSAARNSTGYNEISQMMNISDAWDSFNSYKNSINPNNITPELLSFGSLETKVNNYAVGQISSIKNDFNGKDSDKSIARNDFLSKKQDIMDLETELRRTADKDFQIAYDFIPPSYDNGYMGRYETYDIRTDGLRDPKVQNKMISDMGFDPNLSDIDNISKRLKENKFSDGYENVESNFRGDLFKNLDTLLSGESKAEDVEEKGWSDPTTDLLLDGIE
ncbi:hypothetical protein [Ruminococcus albus]|uniref:hypothetical protein n=1 Tax=Ruminococcus albus TaxID=1264 RepID=UPI000466B9A0|nr:hypothetical protein [Ruminococcus albus]